MKLGIYVTDKADIPHVLELAEFQLSPFVHENLEGVLRNSVFSIGLFNRDKITVHLSFSDHFLLENMISSTSDWVTWLEAAIGRKRFQCFNTLFLQSCIYKTQQKENLQKILKKTFKLMPLVEYFVFFCQNDCEVNTIFHNTFKRKFENGLNDYSLWVCKRNILIPLRIRDVRLGDYDDIVRLTKSEDGLLEKLYGKRYAMDIALVKSKSLFTALAVVDEKPVGFFYASSSDINLEELNVNFQLEEFHGLKKPKFSDEVPQDMIVRTEQAPGEDDEEDGEVITHLSRLHNRQSAYLSGYKKRQIWCKIRNKYGFHPIDDPYQYIIEDEKETVETDDEILFEMERAELPNRPKKHDLPFIPQLYKPQIPKYEGRPNCFEIFHMSIVEKYQSEFLYFLKSAFRKLIHLEYCILMMPCDRPNFFMSQYFFQVPPRPLSCFPQTLLVFHKAGALSNFHVRHCIKADFPKLKHMLKYLCFKNYVLLDIRDILLSMDDNKDGSAAIVATCFDSIVGIAVIKPVMKFEYISSHYNLDGPGVLEQHGMLSHCVLSPSLKLMSKCFLREAMRLAGKSYLYYRIYPPNVPFGNCLWQSGCNVLDDLIPLEPLVPVSYDLKQFREFCPSEEVLETENNFLIYSINKELAVLPRQVNTTRIVVVGASEVALSFLKTIIYNSGILFSSLFIVSPCGLPGEDPFDINRSKFLPNNIYFNESTLTAMCLHSRVNVIYGKMVLIMRKQKRIKLDNGAELAYDYLILTCGLQYQRLLQSQIEVHETKPQKEDEANVNEDDDSHRSKRPTYLPIPVRTWIRPAQNLFAINDTYDAAVVLKWFGEKFAATTGQIIVYGNSIEAYTCLVGILNANVTGDSITFAKTKRDKLCPVFKDKFLENVVTSLLEDVGITVYSKTRLNFQFLEDVIYKVRVTAKNVKRPLDCRAVFMCNEKKVDYVTYNALFRAMMHFDGRLSVDASFKTNDERIYGAGTLTKFHRKYFANHYDGVKFNSTEVGRTLAQSILKVLSQTEMETGGCPTLPSFKEPVITSFELPQGYHYLLINKPRYKYEDLEIPENMKFEKKGYFKPRKIVLSNITRSVLIPADDNDNVYCNEDEKYSDAARKERLYGYDYSSNYKKDNSDFRKFKNKVAADNKNAYEHFSLEFNEFCEVVTIVCFSKTKFPVRNLIKLYGLHYSYFSLLFKEIEDMRPSDAFDFFQQPWCSAMYHDLFGQFRHELREHGPRIEAEKFSKNDLFSFYKNSNYENFIKEKIQEFINKNSTALTTYTAENWGEDLSVE